MRTSSSRNAATRQVRDDPLHGRQAEPRLPHEHDESADSQPMPPPPNDAPIRQAAEDLARGLVDTDEARRAHAVERPGRPRRR